MASVPPPYQPRDNMAAAGPSAHPPASPAVPPVQHAPHQLEFAETTSVSLEWRLTGLKAMYDTSKGEMKSKCIKSAVFGDADNLWEVLWYPNSGAQGGEFASLYLSCVPTQQERDQAPNNKWTRKGLWWFRFEIKSTVPDERTGKIATLATKDAADHTFAVKTANWGWQQFAKRDSLFLHPTVVLSDSFTIVCVIQAQAQPPAGYWLGVGLQPKQESVSANLLGAGGRSVGSGGGLSAWSGGEGASGGVAGGTAAAGGVKKVVPRDLVDSVGALLDDPLYSDIEFIFPASSSRPRGVSGDGERSAPRKIYANKRLLARCDYFAFMFGGSFKEADGIIDYAEPEDEIDTLSDSDMEDEADLGADTASLRLTTTTSRSSSLRHQPASTTGDAAPSPLAHTALHAHGDGAGGEDEHDGEFHDASAAGPAGEGVGVGAGAADVGVGMGMEEETRTGEVASKVPPTPGRHTNGRGPVGGPKKTGVVVRDAAWSTWWAILYWLYTDTIYFAPLTSSFEHAAPTSSLPRGSSALDPPKTRHHWISSWLSEHSVAQLDTDPLGPRPVSAKAVYRLADKLDLPALKLRAFQHIVAGLTAQNIPAEVFSRFSTTFEDVRRVQIAFFLKHWGEIKKSETMTQIWTQIRLGKHVGFEEVWPLIVSQLDFKPS